MKLRIALLTVALFISFVSVSNADTIVKHQVGNTIDAQEAEKYGLFSAYEGFKRAIFSIPDRDDPASDMVSLGEVLLLVESSVGVEDHVIPFGAVRFLNDYLKRYDSFREKNPDEQVRFQPIYELNTVSRQSLDGVIISFDGIEAIIDVGFAKVPVPMEEIYFSKYQRELRDSFVLGDPAASRLFLFPTGRTLGRGNGLFSVLAYIVPSFNYGLTDRVDIGAGVLPLSTAAFFVAWGSAKVGVIQHKMVDVAVGGTNIVLGGEGDEPSSIALLNCTTTITTKRVGISLGINGIVQEGEIEESPVVMVGGELNLKYGIKLITENYFNVEEVDFPAINSFGVRWYNHRITADFAFIRSPEMPFIGIPWIGIGIRF